MSVDFVHICSFALGWWDVRSPSGKQGVTFEDSEQFGPSLIDLRTEELRPVPDRHWFWKFYKPWRDAGRPSSGVKITTRSGLEILAATWVAEQPQQR